MAGGVGLGDDEEFDFLEGNFKKSIVDEVPLIAFFDRIQQILIKDMTTTMVIKLLGRSIGYIGLHNRVCSLWRPCSPFQLMDIENDYFLAKFQCIEDFEKYGHVKELCSTPVEILNQVEGKELVAKSMIMDVEKTETLGTFELWMQVERKS
ncbi:hypothetical protein Gogos_003561 [Gossypium gossypioides]|uniref:DUF4283 domain-containing protein n=1 Tax=Gossypium gossypioides TaxID=34282 RepID=A0A7J9CMK3_GOSGO|nr:hypothetical protein [Gossypium gossypioides]